MSIVVDGDTTTFTETLNCSCCPNCVACQSGNLPDSFVVNVSVSGSAPNFPTFSRFNQAVTVTREEAHTGHFGSSYAGWFFVSGVDDGISDYTEMAVTCDPGSIQINSYRFVAAPDPPDVEAEIIGVAVFPTDFGNSCSPLFITRSGGGFIGCATPGGFFELRGGTVTVSP